MTLVDPVNRAFYDSLWRQDEFVHRYPNVNTVRLERWWLSKNKGAGRLLDYGFGSGAEAVYFAEQGYEVHGLDVSPNALTRLKTRLSAGDPGIAGRVSLGLIEEGQAKLPYPDGFFDCVNSSQVLYHLPDEQAVRTLMAEFSRVLRPGGKCMFSTIGPGNSLTLSGKLVRQEALIKTFELDYTAKEQMQSTKMRCLLVEKAEDFHALCAPLLIEEVGWFSNHYCGMDGFHWMVLAQKPE